jgi:hypothetical protein
MELLKIHYSEMEKLIIYPIRSLYYNINIKLTSGEKHSATHKYLETKEIANYFITNLLQKSNKLVELGLFCQHDKLDYLPSNIKVLITYSTIKITSNTLIYLDELYISDCHLLENLYNINKLTIKYYKGKNNFNSFLELLVNSNVAEFYFEEKTFVDNNYVKQLVDEFGNLKLKTGKEKKQYVVENRRFALVKPAK